MPGETIIPTGWNISITYRTGNNSTELIPVQVFINYIGNFKFQYTFNHSFSPMQSTDPAAQPSSSVVLRGTITTSFGRTILLNRETFGGIAPDITVFMTPDPPNNPNRTINNGCLSYRQPGSSGFSVTNNSSDGSWWNCLSQDGSSIGGGTIGPGQTANLIYTPSWPLGEGCIRDGSIRTEPGVDFTVTYGPSC